VRSWSKGCPQNTAPNEISRKRARRRCQGICPRRVQPDGKRKSGPLFDQHEQGKTSREEFFQLSTKRSILYGSGAARLERAYMHRSQCRSPSHRSSEASIPCNTPSIQCPSFSRNQRHGLIIAMLNDRPWKRYPDWKNNRGCPGSLDRHAGPNEVPIPRRNLPSERSSTRRWPPWRRDAARSNHLVGRLKFLSTP
jgi:hypothetical protein